MDHSCKPILITAGRLVLFHQACEDCNCMPALITAGGLELFHQACKDRSCMPLLMTADKTCMEMDAKHLSLTDVLTLSCTLWWYHTVATDSTYIHTPVHSLPLIPQNKHSHLAG